MKIRTGFVSNSSSSSFCLYGVYLGEENDELREKAEKAGLEYRWGGQTEEYCMGKAWNSIGENQTGGQFKEEIKTKIKELLNKDDVKCATLEESWYNG